MDAEDFLEVLATPKGDKVPGWGFCRLLSSRYRAFRFPGLTLPFLFAASTLAGSTLAYKFPGPMLRVPGPTSLRFSGPMLRVPGPTSPGSTGAPLRHIAVTIPVCKEARNTNQEKDNNDEKNPGGCSPKVPSWFLPREFLWMLRWAPGRGITTRSTTQQGNPLHQGPEREKRRHDVIAMTKMLL